MCRSIYQHIFPFIKINNMLYFSVQIMDKQLGWGICYVIMHRIGKLYGKNDKVDNLLNM